MKAFVFPGQGSQFVGMGKDLYDSNAAIKAMMEEANDILGFRITDIMFSGTDDELKQTRVTQPAVFIHSVALAKALESEMKPDMTAGHSLGEFSALVAAGALKFADALRLVSARAQAMQRACELNPSTMAAIIGLPDEKVEEVCGSLNAGVLACANYNNPGQLVISGEIAAVDAACQALTEAGAKRAIKLKVGGGFHSPCMEPARAELAEAIDHTEFSVPACPVYQNVDALPHTAPAEIKGNLIAQLTAPVRWTASVRNMIADGATEFIEIGPGRALQGMIAKISRDVTVSGIQSL